MLGCFDNHAGFHKERKIVRPKVIHPEIRTDDYLLILLFDWYHNILSRSVFAFHRGVITDYYIAKRQFWEKFERPAPKSGFEILKEESFVESRDAMFGPYVPKVASFHISVVLDLFVALWDSVSYTFLTAFYYLFAPHILIRRWVENFLFDL